LSELGNNNVIGAIVLIHMSSRDYNVPFRRNQLDLQDCSHCYITFFVLLTLSNSLASPNTVYSIGTTIETGS
jgi:hypothetical protein